MNTINLITASTLLLLLSCTRDGDTQETTDTNNIPPQEFGLRDWDSDPPETEFEVLAYFYEAFEESRRRGILKSELHIYDDSNKIVGILKPGIIIHSPSIDDIGDTDISDNWRRKVLFDLPNESEVEWLEDSDKDRLGKSWARNSAAIAETP